MNILLLYFISMVIFDMAELMGYVAVYAFSFRRKRRFPLRLAAFWILWACACMIVACGMENFLAAAYMLFGKPFATLRKEFDRLLNLYVHLMFALILLFITGFQRSNVVMGSGDKWIITVFQLFTIAFCLMLLIMERFMLFWVRDIQEKAAVERIYESYRLQSEIQKQSMELVNIKCHDLKQQVGAMLRQKELDPGFLSDVQQTIAIYDTRIKTGNENLDVVLTEKSLLCEVEGIQLTSMIDGTGIHVGGRLLLLFRERTGQCH